MRTALFVFSIVHYYREMMPVARYFRANGWRVRAIIGWTGNSAERAAEDCRTGGIELVEILPQFLIAGEHGLATPPQAPEPVAAPRKLSLPLRMAMLADSLRKLARIKRYSRKLIDATAPDIVFAGPYHSPDLLHNGIALVCRKRSIPYCCLPVSAYVGSRNSILARFSNRRLGMQTAIIDADYDWLSLIMARFFPQWTATQAGKTIFMWDPMLMLAAGISGFLTRDIWQKPAESFDVVYLYSEFSREMLLTSGYDDGKLAVCGIPLLDEPRRLLADPAHRTAMWRKLNLPKDREFILFNVEPSYEHRYASHTDHWRRFHEMMEVMRRTRMPIVLSLHPLCNLANYEFAEGEYGVTIARDYKIFDLYPYCRFAVSFPCSTNVVAQEFSKPLVIYDYSGMTAEDAPRKDLFRLPNTRYGYDVMGIEREVQAALAAATASEQVPQTPASACTLIFEDVEKRFSLAGPAAMVDELDVIPATIGVRTAIK